MRKYQARFGGGPSEKVRPGWNLVGGLPYTVVVRGLILDHLCDELQTDRKDVSSALKALRLSTRQALNEGWLPN